MSIEKIGNMDTALNVNFKQQVQHRQPKLVDDDASFVHEASANSNTTKVNYPPFLPVGDTQGIYKK